MNEIFTVSGLEWQLRIYTVQFVDFSSIFPLPPMNYLRKYSHVAELGTLVTAD